eukprot:SM000232S07950  [mRNA]  locus=s232:126835:134657:- [translate_table: standard]
MAAARAKRAATNAGPRPAKGLNPSSAAIVEEAKSWPAAVGKTRPTCGAVAHHVEVATAHVVLVWLPSLDGFFAEAEDSGGGAKERIWRRVRELRELVPGAAHVRGLGAVLEHVIAYMQALEARTLAMHRVAAQHRHCQRRATATALKLRGYQGPHPYGHPVMAAATAAAMAVAAGAVEISSLTPPLIMGLCRR